MICIKGYKGDDRYPAASNVEGEVKWQRVRYSYRKGEIRKRKDIFLDPECWRLAPKTSPKKLKKRKR